MSGIQAAKTAATALPFTLWSINSSIFCHFFPNFVNGNRNIRFAYINYQAVMVTRLLGSLILPESWANYILLPIWGVASVWTVMWLNYYFHYADELVHSHLSPDSFHSETLKPSLRSLPLKIEQRRSVVPRTELLETGRRKEEDGTFSIHEDILGHYTGFSEWVWASYYKSMEISSSLHPSSPINGLEQQIWTCADSPPDQLPFPSRPLPGLENSFSKDLCFPFRCHFPRLMLSLLREAPGTSTGSFPK